MDPEKLQIEVLEQMTRGAVASVEELRAIRKDVRAYLRDSDARGDRLMEQQEQILRALSRIEPALVTYEKWLTTLDAERLRAVSESAEAGLRLKTGIMQALTSKTAVAVATAAGTGLAAYLFSLFGGS